MAKGECVILSGGILFNFLWALLLVLALAYVAARLLKSTGLGKRSPSQFIEQLDYLTLGPKRGIAIIQVVDKTLCVAISDRGIELLCEVDGDALKDRMTHLPAISRVGIPGLGQFAEEVWQHLKRSKAGG
ncbi:MAG: flagellar biosynthetic protein FliO [Firmicutes bacterium]|nr:flagellar biosynthetic protein FliO [Bacillota bacterium]MCL5065656.1 flagellar biosynthetic protein FliO [Bacillota bacterium]